MPQITSRDITIALDMFGCPNRCRHCYIGNLPNGRMSVDDLRWTAAQFRSYIRPGETQPFIEKFTVSSSLREPDFSDDYKHLYELEAELSDAEPNRFELLSIWRLARDPEYARWAKQVGPDTCQITFFGLEETQDWFYRRKGAFQDCIKATERLLEIGMKPRWQLFLTKKILPDIAGLTNLVDKMRIRERVTGFGGDFVIFIHPPSLDGEGLKIADLSVDLEDTKHIPTEIIESTQTHFGTEKIWTTEAEDYARVISDTESPDAPYSYPQPFLCFFISSNWDVFSNIATTSPWWKLGNLKKDSIESIFESFEVDNIMPLALNRADTVKKAAKLYGDQKSMKVVNGIDQHWCERYFEEIYQRG